MKNLADLLIIIGLAAALIAVALLESPVIKGMVALLLALLTILLTIIKFKTSQEMNGKDKFLDLLSLLVVIGASAFIIYKMISL
jgi:hypothetical protein